MKLGRKVKGTKLIVKEAKISHLKNCFDDCGAPTQLYKQLRFLSHSNPKKTFKSALDYFCDPYLLNHFQTLIAYRSLVKPNNLMITTGKPNPLPPDHPHFSFASNIYSEVLSVLNHVKNTSKRQSPDGLKRQYFSDLIPQFATFFTAFYNKLLIYSQYPDPWKISLIVPLIRKQNPTSLYYTRPISDIFRLAKPLDRILRKRISNYFEQNDLISDQQFGYRTGHSSQTLLLKLVQNIRRAIN